MPPEHQKMKISKLDKQEHEKDLKLPEVSTETFETVKADLVDVDMKANSCDKDIEKRLTKLKFFNQTWLLRSFQNQNNDGSEERSRCSQCCS